MKHWRPGSILYIVSFKNTQNCLFVETLNILQICTLNMSMNSLIVFFMAYYTFKFTNSNYMLLQIKNQNHNHIVNSKSSKIKARRLSEASKKKLISAFESNQINIECKCNHEGKCEAKGCNLRGLRSGSIGGNIRLVRTYFRPSYLLDINIV